MEVALQTKLLSQLDRADKAVDDLCRGRLRWEMRVPAEPDHDPDLIISTALRGARLLVDAIETEWYNGNIDEGARDRLMRIAGG